MPTTANGAWAPRIFQKQADLINVCRSGKKRFILASGPRYSGKTLGSLHAIVDHAWNVDHANIAVVTVTQSAGYDSGVWTDLCELTVPEWIEGGFGMEWIRPPSIAHVSKKPYFIISNRWGGQSRFQLESLKNEQEVEQRFKGKRYSAMFVNELSNFKQRKTLDTWSECLRMVKVPPEKHFLLGDTNPADEGAKSWIYKLWYEFPNIQDGLSTAEENLQELLALVEFTIPDNIFAPAERVEQLKGMLSNNRDLYDRYVLGRWVTSSLDALFVDVFREGIHVIGQDEGPGVSDPMIMAPEETCYELYTGWDLGVKNSAAVIAEKTFNPDDRFRRPIFKFLDELVILDEDFSMEDFVRAFVEKMRFWEQRVNASRVKWTHYSDRSAFDMKDPVSNRYHHQIVYEASPDDTPGGRIELIAAARGRNSIQQRVDLWRKLLWEERAYLSRAFCPNLIDMCKSIKKGKTTLAPIEKGSRWKHVFDAATYLAASECYDEMMAMVMQLVKRRSETSSGFITIGL